LLLLFKCYFDCEVSKMVGPKKQDLWPKINTLKWNYCILWMQWITVCLKVPKFYFQSQFSMSRIKGFFLFKNINLGDNFFIKNIFFTFNFWGTLFSKNKPNFWRTAIYCIHKIKWFLLGMLTFGLKFCFLGPTTFEIPQPSDINKYFHIRLQTTFL
jgi:hypothetical protein